jgi:hypothetical protein
LGSLNEQHAFHFETARPEFQRKDSSMRASAVISVCFTFALEVVLFAAPQDQVSSSSTEQLLSAAYRPTDVAIDGSVAHAGTVLVVRASGIVAESSSKGCYRASSYKNGRVKQGFIQNCGATPDPPQFRPLNVGEKVYLTSIEFKNTEIVFKVQSCGTCDSSKVGPSDVPYRASLAVQLQKGYSEALNLKETRDTIGEVFGIDSTSQVVRKDQAAVYPPVATLKLPATYASAQSSADQLQLNADKSFSLQVAGQTYHGTFAQNGKTLELNISGADKATATIEGDRITDNSGQIWMLRDQSPAPAASQAALHNQDIIDLATAGIDDATILAKIANSKCQFDTSTTALIQLKKSGVSAAVIKAMVGAGK